MIAAVLSRPRVLVRSTFTVLQRNAADKCDRSSGEQDKSGKTQRMKTFKIYRYCPESAKTPYMKSYTIDLNTCGPMILDALNIIKIEHDSTLSYRRSCREGVCGSCALNVDGVNGLACTKIFFDGDNKTDIDDGINSSSSSSSSSDEDENLMNIGFSGQMKKHTICPLSSSKYTHYTGCLGLPDIFVVGFRGRSYRINRVKTLTAHADHLQQDSNVTRTGLMEAVSLSANLAKIRPGGVTKLYPLPHMYVLKDLIVDFKQFLKQHNRIKPYLIRKCKEPIGKKQYMQSIKDRDELDGFIECILCACCSTSCPEYWWHGHTSNKNDFIGPAALLNANRWLMDSRDQGTEERLNDLRSFYAVYRCHTIMNCTKVCPKGLNPGKAIANVRLMLAGSRGKIQPEFGGMGDTTAKCDKPPKKK